MESYSKQCPEPLKTCPYLPWMIDFNTTECGTVPKYQLSAAFAETHLDYLSKLHPRSKNRKVTLTQMMVTIVPSVTYEDIMQLLHNEMRVVLINVYLFDPDEVRQAVKMVRCACNDFSKDVKYAYPLSIGLDFSELKTKIGRFRKGIHEVRLCEGDTVTMTHSPEFEKNQNKEVLYVSEDMEFLKPGDSLIIGEARLSAINISRGIVECIVNRAGKIIDNLVIDFPNKPVVITASETMFAPYIEIFNKYHLDLCLAPPQQIDFLRQHTPSYVLIFCKVDSEKYVDYIDEIIARSDGIFLDNDRLLCRLEQNIYIFQKMICGKCNRLGKPVLILANFDAISRSVVMDIANAIIDGIDGIIVPPLPQCLASISSICRSAEMSSYQRMIYSDLIKENVPPFEPINATCNQAVKLANDVNASVIIAITTSGRVATMMARLRPRCPIFAITKYTRVSRRLRCFRGVIPILVHKTCDDCDYASNVIMMMQNAINFGKQHGLILMGDALVLVSNSRSSTGFPNDVKVVYASQYNVKPQQACVTRKEELLAEVCPCSCP